MPKTLAQIMADMAADGVTVTVSTRNPDSVSGLIGQAAKDAGNYRCVICGGGAGHDSAEHDASTLRQPPGSETES